MKKKRNSDNKLDVFAAIGDPTRRQILYLLAAGTLSVTVIAGNFSISRPAISKHIKVLKEAGLIQITESGRENICELAPDGFEEIKDWLSFYENFWKQNLSKLGQLLNKRNSANVNKQL